MYDTISRDWIKTAIRVGLQPDENGMVNLNSVLIQIDSAPEVDGWISVEEQPNPSKDGVYLCHGYWIRSGRKQTETAEYLGEWKIANNFVLTHWMPLPEPPEEE